MACTYILVLYLLYILKCLGIHGIEDKQQQTTLCAKFRSNLKCFKRYKNQIRPGGFSFLGKKDLGYILYGGLPPPNLNKPVKQPSPK